MQLNKRTDGLLDDCMGDDRTVEDVLLAIYKVDNRKAVSNLLHEYPS